MLYYNSGHLLRAQPATCCSVGVSITSRPTPFSGLRDCELKPEHQAKSTWRQLKPHANEDDVPSLYNRCLVRCTLEHGARYRGRGFALEVRAHEDDDDLARGNGVRSKSSSRLDRPRILRELQPPGVDQRRSVDACSLALRHAPECERKSALLCATDRSAMGRRRDAAQLRTLPHQRPNRPSEASRERLRVPAC